MTKYIACLGGRDRSGAIVELYQQAGKDVKLFPGGITEMLSMEKAALESIVTTRDSVVLICDDVFPWEYEWKQSRKARDLLSSIKRRSQIQTSLSLMKRIAKRR